jgi:hypothetical protein
MFKGPGFACISADRVLAVIASMRGRLFVGFSGMLGKMPFETIGERVNECLVKKSAPGLT